MPTSLTREQARLLDRRAIDEVGIPSLVLMENAGRGAAELLMRLGIQGQVTICCGKGNNGADGLVVARHLVNHGHPVRINMAAGVESLSPEAATQLRIVQWMGISIRNEFNESDHREADWIVDALFGTGMSGQVREPFAQMIERINGLGKPVLALDIPSGLDADTGEPLGCAIQATHTATFVAPKVGFAQPAAQPYVGQIHVIDIGAPRSLLT